MTKYIGITIGPILETINLTSSPAALWAASYLFSTLTGTICEILTEEYGVAKQQLVSPYYDKDDPLLNRNNGIGLFHDRIIFRAENFDYSVMEDVRKKSVAKIATKFGIESHIDYLNQYIQIASVQFEAENPILESSQVLDCLELAKPFVFKEDANPILGLFTSTGKTTKQYNSELAKVGKNEAIKKLTLNLKNFQLLKHSSEEGGVLKSLSDIVETGRGFKKYKYYAIVRSDGDNMSSILSTLKSDDEINAFSKTCLQYCSDVSEAVGRYNGATIYAGGDDLLAILPCESKNGKTIFEFVSEANEIFEKHLKESGLPVTSLSFGITIAYYKFPLYEALANSANLLFGVAKSLKNCVAIQVQKHSGQTEGIIISNDRIKQFITDYLHPTMQKNSDTLLSAMHKIALFETAFSHVTDYETAKNLFVNTFDAAYHTNNHFVHSTLPKLFWALKSQNEESGIYALTENGPEKTDAVLIINYILRILKFFVEKDGETK